ncbi:MAG: hypothetical protein ACXVCP_08815 [Bdellovibrio sp.]
MTKNIVQIFILLFLLNACTGKHGYHEDTKKEVKIPEFNEDVKIPSQAWDLLENKSTEHAAAEAESGGGGHSSPEPAAAPKKIIFSEVTVILSQKNPGIIKNEAVKISLPKGGGVIDLSQFVTANKGSFFVGFEFPAFEGATSKKVIFVSETRKRRIGSEVFGAGCNKFFDITEKFFKEMKGEGIKVNTTQERYLSVIGGKFLFSAKKDIDTYVAQVTFLNSDYPSLFCKEH